MGRMGVRRAALAAALASVAVATASVPASPDALTGAGGIDGGQVRAVPRFEPAHGTVVVEPPDGEGPIGGGLDTDPDPYQWQ
jgi:hypothetical protein